MVEESAGKPAVRTREVPEGNAGQRLDNFLMGLLPGAPRSVIYKIIRTGQVRVNGGRAKPATRLAAGDLVRIPPIRLPAPEQPGVPDSILQVLAAAVIHEDEDLLVLDKPAGVAVHAGSGVRWGVIDAMRQLRPGTSVELVHRLDRDTSGCLLLAKTRSAMLDLQSQFRRGEPDKRYLCLMDGRMPEERVLVDQPLLKTERSGERFMIVGERGKPAKTVFRRIQVFPDCSYSEASLLTGRTHQIRAHAAFLGLPLAGDTRYASAAACQRWQSRGLQRLFLHAHSLTVRDAQGNLRQFSCPLPAELRKVLDEL